MYYEFPVFFFNNGYQQDSRVLYIFVPNKSFSQLIYYFMKHDSLIKKENLLKQKIK